MKFWQWQVQSSWASSDECSLFYCVLRKTLFPNIVSLLVSDCFLTWYPHRWKRDQHDVSVRTYISSRASNRVQILHAALVAVNRRRLVASGPFRESAVPCYDARPRITELWTSSRYTLHQWNILRSTTLRYCQARLRFTPPPHKSEANKGTLPLRICFVIRKDA